MISVAFSTSAADRARTTSSFAHCIEICTRRCLKNRALLRRSFEALPSGGAVVVSELLVNDEKTGPAPAALMSLNMLIETEGRNYTPAEYSTWLEDAGFRQIETVWFEAPAANGAVIGHKP